MAMPAFWRTAQLPRYCFSTQKCNKTLAKLGFGRQKLSLSVLEHTEKYRHFSWTTHEICSSMEKNEQFFTWDFVVKNCFGVQFDPQNYFVCLCRNKRFAIVNSDNYPPSSYGDWLLPAPLTVWSEKFLLLHGGLPNSAPISAQLNTSQLVSA